MIVEKKTYVLFFVAFLFSCGIVRAQSVEVSGVVTDASTNETLPGVNISVKGTSSGTVTDENGSYTITVPNANSVLIFSFVGFKKQQISVNGRENIDVTLQTQALEGEELVVVGYGTQQKSDLTGSISSVDSSAITQQPSLTATEALQGKVAGVNIINNDAPGGTPTVIMRGLGTALGGRNPLYIVDGVPTDNINNIAPSDIKNIDFLKDAASASIYGLRAANGVIIVTTKNGKQGAPQFGVKAYSGYQNVLNQVKMANADEYIQYFNEESTARKQYLGADNTYQLSSDHQYDTNWFDELIKPGYVVNTTASVSGGSDNINYYLSYNLNDEKGILEGQHFWRQTIRNNNEYHVFGDFLEIDQNLNLSFSKEIPKPFSAFGNAYTQSPIVPVRFPNGRYGQPFVNTATGQLGYTSTGNEAIARLNDRGNPVAGVDLSNSENRTVQLQGKVSAIFNLTKYLTFTSRLGATKFYSNNWSFNDIKAGYLAADPSRTAAQFEAEKGDNPTATNRANNSYYKYHNETLHWNWDNFFNFDDSFGKHNLSATLGMSSEKVGVGYAFSGTAYDVPAKEQYWSLNLASDQYEKTVDQNYYTPNTLLSYFGRVQYNYDRRYYLTANLRRDGSSKFANTADYYDLFPSAAIAWNITNENFMSDNDVLNLLKLRVSWGKLGNQNVPFNTTTILTSIGSSTQNYVFGPDQTLRFGAYVGSPAKPISWEIVKEWNAGLDYGLLNNRLSGSLEFYQKTTENIILQVQPIPDSQFQGNFFDEGGKVVNKGVEFSASWSDNLSDDFSYSVGVNASYNYNEVTDVRAAYEGQTGGSLNNGFITKRLADNEPLGSWWMYEANGVWQDSASIANNPSIGGAHPGHLRYKDQNGDGVIDDRDKKYYGSYVPKYNLGLNIGLNYKQFDFSMDAFGVAGNKVYNALKNLRRGGENITQDVFKNRWIGPNSPKNGTGPGAFRDYVPSSYYLEDGAYLRINNITLGYTLNNIVKHVSNLRFYVSAQNPFLFTNYSGFTPELVGNGAPYGTSGIEISAYPNTRTLLFGINVDFQ